MPQFLLIGILLSIVGVLVANWQKVVMVVILLSLAGFGVLVLVNGLSVSAAFDSMLSTLATVWASILELGQSIFSESKIAVENTPSE